MLTRAELLDRMEILYPLDPRFGDLRRAYIDSDISSIFRLMEGYRGSGVADIRKLTMENNLHVLFRLMDSNFEIDISHRHSAWIQEGDLRKFLLEDNTWSMYRLLLDFADNQIIRTIKSMHASGDRWDKDAMSRGQLESKMWLVNELAEHDLELGTVFLCAGWYGLLANLMFSRDLNITKVCSFDLDQTCAPVAKAFNKQWVMDDWKFQAVTQDIHAIDFHNHAYTVHRADGTSVELTAAPDTIINTSCEHIKDFAGWYAKIPMGKLVILQSNDYFEIPEHVNCSANKAEFNDSVPMSDVLYLGERPLEKYTRFMKIGYK